MRRFGEAGLGDPNSLSHRFGDGEGDPCVREDAVRPAVLGVKLARCARMGPGQSYAYCDWGRDDLVGLLPGRPLALTCAFDQTWPEFPTAGLMR